MSNTEINLMPQFPWNKGSQLWSHRDSNIIHVEWSLGIWRPEGCLVILMSSQGQETLL